MEGIKAQGWFYTAGETYNDVAAISTPLFDNQKYILGSLSIAGPVFRLNEEQVVKILPILKECQKEINSIFGKVTFPTRRKQLMEEQSFQ